MAIVYYLYIGKEGYGAVVLLKRFLKSVAVGGNHSTRLAKSCFDLA